MKFPSSLPSSLPDRAPSSRVQTRTRMAPPGQSHRKTHGKTFLNIAPGKIDDIETTRDTSPTLSPPWGHPASLTGPG